MAVAHEGEAVADQITRLTRRAEVLRQIHSDKMFRVDKAHRRSTLALLTATAAVGFVGFTGTDRLQQQVRGLWDISLDAVNMLYNALVLVTLIVAIATVVYRFPERAAQHHRAIQALSEFILDCDSRLLLARSSAAALTERELELVTSRYKGLTSALPPSSDKEFLASKKALRDKEAASHGMPRVDGQRIAGSACPADEIGRFIASSALHQAAADTVGRVGDETRLALYICGGFVRNLVWDALHGYVVATPPDDIDVVFVADDASLEEKVLASLIAELPNLHWSVRNLATIEPKVGTGRYGDVFSALADFPETASAVAVRPIPGSPIEFLAPLGTGDLFGGIIRPTTASYGERVAERVATKEWLVVWPLLQLVSVPVISPPTSQSGWNPHNRREADSPA